MNNVHEYRKYLIVIASDPLNICDEYTYNFNQVFMINALRDTDIGRNIHLLSYSIINSLISTILDTVNFSFLLQF